MDPGDEGRGVSLDQGLDPQALLQARQPHCGVDRTPLGLQYTANIPNYLRFTLAPTTGSDGGPLLEGGE